MYSRWYCGGTVCTAGGTVVVLYVQQVVLWWYCTYSRWYCIAAIRRTFIDANTAVERGMGVAWACKVNAVEELHVPLHLLATSIRQLAQHSN